MLGALLSVLSSLLSALGGIYNEKLLNGRPTTSIHWQNIQMCASPPKPPPTPMADAHADASSRTQPPKRRAHTAATLNRSLARGVSASGTSGASRSTRSART